MILIKPKMNFSTMKYRKSFQLIYNFIPFFSKRKIRKKIGENGAFPPTRNGCIHSLSMREMG